MKCGSAPLKAQWVVRWRSSSHWTPRWWGRRRLRRFLPPSGSSWWCDRFRWATLGPAAWRWSRCSYRYWSWVRQRAETVHHHHHHLHQFAAVKLRSSSSSSSWTCCTSWWWHQKPVQTESLNWFWSTSELWKGSTQQLLYWVWGPLMWAEWPFNGVPSCVSLWKHASVVKWRFHGLFHLKHFILFYQRWEVMKYKYFVTVLTALKFSGVCTSLEYFFFYIWTQISALLPLTCSEQAPNFRIHASDNINYYYFASFPTSRLISA